MRYPSVLLVVTAYILGASAAPGVTSARSFAEAPCDAWSDECREVITANACFAAYVPSKNKTQILECVDVDDPVVAERKICACYGCSEKTVQDYATADLGCH
ncbi:hypothetical protein B0T19DRAFT_83285 [Cercophora scortea]|uniref:Uncharacterized protein n=1 Tax=Cercophora scortea TaxID=314031 RepID=A0AAE0MH63_9PEZI|nr:hypothetical protein B0T19DRAFT_83285 [Cercophora scortea]